MNANVRALRADTNAIDAVRWLADHGYSGAPVVDAEGVLCGVFSEHDAVSALLDALNEAHVVGDVAAYMTREVEQVAPNQDLRDLALLFAQKCYRRMPVVDEGGKLLGLITRRELVGSLLSLTRPSPQPTTYDLLRARWS